MITASFTSTPGAGADVDRDGRIPDGRRAADDPAGHPLVRRERRVGSSRSSSLRNCSFSPTADCGLGELGAQVLRPRRAAASFSPRASKVSPNQLTGRGRASSARRRPPRPAESTVEMPRWIELQRAAVGLAEADREQHQAGDDQCHQDRPAPADLLAVHRGLGRRRRRRDAGGGSSSGSSGG